MQTPHRGEDEQFRAMKIECNENNRTALVDRYLLGGMKRKEREAFEAHFPHCDACYEQLLQSKQIIADMQKAARKAGWNKSQLQQLSNLLEGGGVFSNFNWRLASGIALFLMVAIVVPLMWWAKKPSTQMALLVSLKRETALDAGAIDSTGVLDHALAAHRAGDDDATIGQLQNRLRELTNPISRANAERLLGLAYLFKKDPRSAIAHLQTATLETTANAQQLAEWYLVEAFLLLGNQKGAVRALKNIAATDSTHQVDAQDLLDKLDKITPD